MKNEKGKLYYGLGLDNDQLRADAAESRNIIKGIGDTTAAEGARIDNSYRKIAGTVAAVFTVQQAAAFAKSIVQVRGEIESLEISFETLLGNKQKANALFSEIKTYAVNTPMQMNDLAKGAQMLLSFNVEAERVMPILKQIGDISMGDAQKFNSLTLAFSQMSSTGKLMGQDLLQMINAGFNPLSVISEKTGKSIGQLKKEMEGGLITSQMVADAFAAATAEGGKFYGMLDKQSKGINGSMSNLEGAITDMLNDIGTENQELITSTIQGATTIVKHYKDIEKVLVGLIATYGVYKASLMVNEAISNAHATLRYQAEIEELQKLIVVKESEKNLDLQKLVTEGKLSAAQATKIAQLREILSEQLRIAQQEAANAALQVRTAKAEIMASGEKLSATRVKIAALREQYAAEVAAGNATAANSTQEKINAELKAYGAAKTALKAKQTSLAGLQEQASAKAIAANTLQQNINNVSTVAAAKAKGILSLAVGKLTKVFNSLKVAFATNPFGMILTAITLVISAVSMFSQKSEEAEEDILGVARAAKKAGEDLNTEAAKIQALQDVLNNGNLAYRERKKALEELRKIVPDYNAQLTAEGTLINNNTEAIKNYLVQFERQIKMKAAREELEEAYKQKGTLEKTEREQSDKYWDVKQTNSLQGYKRNSVTAKLSRMLGLEEEDNAKKALDETQNKLKDINSTISKLNAEIESTAVSSSNSVEENKTYAQQLAETTQSIAKLKSELVDLKAGKGDEADFADAIEKKSAALKEAQKKYNTLLGITDTGGKTENEAARIKREIAERTKKIKEYEEAVKKQARQSELDIAQATIDAKEEGYDKELEQIGHNYDRMIFANEQRVAEMVKALQDARELEWENEHPKAKSKGETFDRSTVTVADLSPEQKAQITAYTDIANNFREKSETDLLKKLLDKYLTFEQQRTEINKRFDNERKTIENSNKTQSEKDSAISVLEKKRKDEIKAVNDEEVESMQKSSDLLVKLFADASQKSVKELRSIINTTEELLTYLEQTNSADITPKFGFSAEELKTLKESPEKLRALREAIKGLNGELGSRSPFEKFANDIDKAIEKIKSGDIGGGLEGIGISIQAIMPTVKQFGEDLGTIFGDSQIGEDIGILTELVGGIGKGIQGIGQIASGDILGGITSVVSGIASIFSMANAAAERHREALEAVMNAKIAQQREYNLLLLKQNLLYEQGTTIFGNDGYGKAVNAIEVYKKALADLNDAMAGNDAQKKSQRGRNHILAMFGIKDAQSTLKQIYAGLADIEIVTGHKKTGLFGWGKGKDLYSSVLSVYPDLIKANGEFNKELAETIISTRKMSDEDKNALQNMVDLYEQYEEAMQSVRDYLSGIFGELGNTMSDALVDAFKNGTDAGEAFYKSVSEMLENLAQQMIYSVTLAPIMEKAQEQMLEIMKNGNLSDAEKFAQYANVLSNLTDEAIAQQGNANDLMKMYQDMAAQKGIDIFQQDEEREASKRGIATASQESVDENNGRLTVMQGHTYTLVENSKILVANSNRVLDHLAGIESNTQSLARLEKIETDMGAVKNTLSDIALKGIKIK